MALLSISCVSRPPKIFSTDPTFFEKDKISVSFYIGSKVYYIKISNNSLDEIIVDTNRMALISNSKEVRNLNPKFWANTIPPKSVAVYTCEQDTFFRTDIEALFEGRNEYYDSPSFYKKESYFLNLFKEEIIRLYIPYVVKGEYKIIDFEITLKGVLGQDY